MTRRQLFEGIAIAAGTASAQTGAAGPWYRRTHRWGQTNITEKDPVRYDIPWWRGQWKRTRVQGVIINAGGIVAYYPSKFPLQHRAEFLNGRDLYGELTAAAHADSLAVLARMDSNRASEAFYKQHPDWFAVDANGAPYRAAEKYISCVNSPYYDEYLPGVLEEIIGRSHPEGVTDNSWSGLNRDSICYCDYCARKFGQPLPKKHDWDDPVYREWIRWSYRRRLAIWDLNNRVTRGAGGPDCLWIGMNGGTIAGQSRAFRDYREICRRAEIIMLDHQARSDASGFQQNSESGKLIHGILGWDKLIPESMAMYQSGRDNFRVAAKPAAEARMWMIEGFAGGIQPWWHHIGAYQEDRRMFATAEPVMRWHEENEKYLVNRRPLASVGVAWSQQNTDFYGRDAAEELTESPYRGLVNALVRARIPYLPVHIDDLDSAGLALVILPNIAAMSDEQCARVRRFAERGGGLIATGSTSLYTEDGTARVDYGLADLFGAHRVAPPEPRAGAGSAHTYLRLTPEDRRHPVLAGFGDTDILAFGGTLDPLRVDAGATVPLTFIPPFPVFPPETSWMRTPKTDIPGLILRDRRIAFLPADIDRRYNRDNLPDHARLIENLVRWASGGDIPLAIEGRGFLDCDLYRRPGRLILHIVNLTNPGAWRAPIDEYFPVGPLDVRVKLPAEVRAQTAQLRVSGGKASVRVENGWATFRIDTVVDHEVAVLGE
jgi:hypothetical protein